ncbi:hypothetical protein Q3G72_015713 [Acer saccharum]|nr:hypothetical protein Q3G72_015713 [Acer saccharum]
MNRRGESETKLAKCDGYGSRSATGLKRTAASSWSRTATGLKRSAAMILDPPTQRTVTSVSATASESATELAKCDGCGSRSATGLKRTAATGWLRTATGLKRPAAMILDGERLYQRRLGIELN